MSADVSQKEVHWNRTRNLTIIKLRVRFQWTSFWDTSAVMRYSPVLSVFDYLADRLWQQVTAPSSTLRRLDYFIRFVNN